MCIYIYWKYYIYIYIDNRILTQIIEIQYNSNAAGLRTIVY